MSNKQKILISNLVYGEPYTAIFLTLHLKSLLENCHPAPFSRDSIYIIYTDGKNIETIKSHENFRQLGEYFEVFFAQIQGDLKYERRYSNQTIQLQHSMKLAMERSALMHHAAADLYYGELFWEKALGSILNRNVDAIFGHPLRTAYEAVGSVLTANTFSNDQLFELGFRCLHPIWAFGNWESPMFSNIPYALLWTTGDQIILRNFSISVLLFRPSEALLKAGGCSDMTILPNCKSFHVHSEWQEVPLIETCMLMSFYPPFAHRPASVTNVAAWAKRAIPPSNYKNIRKFFILKKSSSVPDWSLIERSGEVSDAIISALET